MRTDIIVVRYGQYRTFLRSSYMKSYMEFLSDFNGYVRMYDMNDILVNF